MAQKLWVEKKDFAAYLTIHNPEKRNALTPEMLVDLYNHLTRFAKNDDVRCVVIQGSGDKAFSSGYDIAALPAAPREGEKQQTPDVLIRALKTIKDFPYPTIAMLNGHVFGAGVNLCACCDIRIAAEDIKMGMTPARLGVAYHPEGIQQFIEAFGIAVTKEIFYTAGVFEGRDLLSKGLVNHLIPRPDLEAFTENYARRITGNAPLSLKGIKEIIAMFESGMALGPDHLDRADRIMQHCFKSDDLKEGQTAFLEKRAPKFTGK